MTLPSGAIGLNAGVRKKTKIKPLCSLSTQTAMELPF